MAEENTSIKQLLIRPFSAGDQDASRRLILNGLGEHFGHIDESLNPDVDDIESHYVLAGQAFVVASLEGTLVGTAALLNEAPGTGRLVRVSVDGRWRRLGIGRSLVRHLIALARQQRLDCILVETNHDWLDVIRFYQNLGFAEYDRDMESVHLRLCLA